MSAHQTARAAGLEDQFTPQQTQIGKFDPLPHQVEAADAIVERLAVARATQAHLACGTGKTYLGLFVAQRLEPELSLVLEPSLGLTAQTLKVWQDQALVPTHFLAVCSDPSVARGVNSDEIVVRPEELGVPVTTDPEVVRSFMQSRPGEPKVVLSTYQSSPVLAEAQAALRRRPIDFAVFDEAHCTTGVYNSAGNGPFSLALRDEALLIKRRLFLTATPRIFTERAKATSEGEVFSMDDPAVYGEVAYKLPFSSAIERGLLSPYRVLVAAVNEADLPPGVVINKGQIRYKGKEISQDTFDRLVQSIALEKAIQEYGLERIISFHGSIAKARAFADMERSDSFVSLLSSVHGQRPDSIVSQLITGSMSASERELVLNNLRSKPPGVTWLVANCRCLTLGIDVPELDAVAFVDPKKAEVDIVQAVGRAIRKARGTDKTTGYVIVPVFVPMGADPSKVMEASDFAAVWRVVRALRSHDDILAVTLDRIKQGGSGGRGSADELPIEVIGSLPPERMGRLRSAICIKAVEEVGKLELTKEWLKGVIDAYRAANGNSFPSQQSGEVPGHPGVTFMAINGRLSGNSHHGTPPAMTGYTSLADFINKEYSWERTARTFEFTVANLRAAVDAYRAANEGRFPSHHSGEVPGHPGLTFGAIHQRLRRKPAQGVPGILAGYTSLAGFLDKEYPEERAAKRFEYTVKNLRRIINAYREAHSKEFPVIDSGPVPGYPGLTFKKVDYHLRGMKATAPALPGYTSLPDFIDKEYPQERVTRTFEYSVVNIRSAIDAYRAEHGGRFPSRESGEVPGYPGLTFGAIHQRLRGKPAQGVPGIIVGYASLTDFLDKEYPEERAAMRFEYTVASVRAAIDAYRAANAGKFPVIQSGKVPGYPSLTFAAIDQRLRGNPTLGVPQLLPGYSSLPDFIDKEYPEERGAKSFEYTVAALRAAIDAYRASHDGSFPTNNSDEVPGYPGLTFSAVSRRLHGNPKRGVAPILPGYTSLQDFINKTY